MKRLMLKITTLIMIFALTLSLSGCFLFQETGIGDSSTPTVVAPLKNKAEFGTVAGERVAKTKTQVIADVRGSVVAITMGTSAGSGVIVDITLKDEGGNFLGSSSEFYILTCHHVIDSTGDIVVYLPDAENDNYGESDYDEANYAFDGKIGGGMHDNLAVTLIGGDQKSDIALLKLTVQNSAVASKIVKAKFPPESNYEMMVGEDVIAIGNPAGDLPGTVSVGTISYINRETEVGGIGTLSLIQLDAHISHGSSGGALFNLYGELIGITNAGRDPSLTTDSEGDVKDVTTYGALNFAIPYVVDEANGQSDFGFMNIAGQLLASKTSTNYGYVPGRVGLFGFTTIESNATVQVSDVTAGSQAALSGIRKGDIVLNVEKGERINVASNRVTTNAQVTAQFSALSVGEKITVRVYRSSDNRNHDITMTALQYKFCDTGK